MNQMPDKTLIENFTRQDRDTIIRLDTKFDRLSQDIKELKDSVVDRISRLEIDRASKKDLDTLKERAEQLALRKVNHEDIVILCSKVETLESWKSWVIGAFSLAGLVAALATYIYFSDLNHIKLDLEKHITQTK
jgi:hypothetical protein